MNNGIEYEGVYYDAILVRGNPCFRANRSLVANELVPENVKAELVNRLLGENVEAPVEKPAERPTEAGVRPIFGGIVEGSTDEQYTPDDSELAATEEQVQEAVEALTATDTTEAADFPTLFEQELIQRIEELEEKLAAKELDGEIRNVTIEELAKQLRDKFGVYTVFAGEAPRPSDINPFSGDVMTRYELGLAYQKFNQARISGKLKKDFADKHEKALASHEANRTHLQEIENRSNGTVDTGFKSFVERTSVHGQRQSSTKQRSYNNDPISEDLVAEPNVNGQTIRREW